MCCSSSVIAFSSITCSGEATYAANQLAKEFRLVRRSLARRFCAIVSQAKDLSQHGIEVQYRLLTDTYFVGRL